MEIHDEGAEAGEDIELEEINTRSARAKALKAFASGALLVKYSRTPDLHRIKEVPNTGPKLSCSRSGFALISMAK